MAELISRQGHLTLLPTQHGQSRVEGTFGILVLPFEGSSREQVDKGVEVQGTIRSILNARFQELNIPDAEARAMSASHVSQVNTHEKARALGKTYYAKLVIWGDVNLAGIIPKLTIVNPPAEFEQVIKPETTLFKDKLSTSALANITDIRLSALTDEPTLLVSFATGLKYFYEKQNEKAIEYFEASLPKNPETLIESTTILFYIGNAFWASQKYEDAIANYNRVLKLDPRFARAYYNRGLAYRSKGDNKRAIDDFTEALKLDPRDARAYNNRGVAYLYKREEDRAIDDFTKALNLDPGLAAAYINRGSAYGSKGDNKRAIDDFTEALKLDLRDARAYNNLKRVYKKKRGND